MRKLLVSLSLLPLATVALAQETPSSTAFDIEKLAIEAGYSTQGYFITPEYSITDSFRVRVPLYFGGQDMSMDTGDTEIDYSLSHNAIGVMADYYILGGPIRLSGGLISGGYNLTADIKDLDLDGYAYSGDFSLEIEPSLAIAPVVALGTAIDIEQFGVHIDIGARLSGLSISSTGQNGLPVALRNDYNDSIDDINDDLESIPLLPYLSIGLRYSF